MPDDLPLEELIRRIRTLVVDRAPGRPRLYQPVTLLWAIGRARRGDPRVISWEETSDLLGSALDLHGGGPRPEYPIAALVHAKLWNLPDFQPRDVPSAHGHPETWFNAKQPRGGLDKGAYELVRSSGAARIAAVYEILDSFFKDANPGPLLEDVGLLDDHVADDSPGGDLQGGTPPAARDQYQRLCEVVENHESEPGRRSERNSSHLLRYPAARKAVLIRSEGRCENPGCPGQPDDVTDRGDPILEVDHIEQLAGGGRDYPSQMIALCPNCHAVKTRGRSRDRLITLLLAEAERLHAKWRG